MSSSVKRAEAYNWGDTIGEGAFGAVILADEKETGRKVAIKILNKDHMVKEKKQKYVKTERDILLKCKHPNIIKLYNTFQDEENLYYVLELASEGELLQHIRKHGSFSLECSAFYLAEIISGLEYLHNLGIIHRDLKPENILLDSNMHVKITDFGTAKEIGTDQNARANSFTGTPEYISPELLDNQGASRSSDLWALGCILYQMITGRPPFRGKTFYLTIEKVKLGHFEYPKNFPEDAKDLIQKLLTKDPAQRLGANQIEDLKAHKFFDQIDWSHLQDIKPPTIKQFPIKLIFPEDFIKEEEERKRLEQEELRKQWGKYINSEETILESGFLYKRRKMSRHKRMFLLTDLPRFVYIDAKKGEKKGEILLNKECKIEVKNNFSFNIKLPKRTYILEDPTRDAERWKKMFENLNKP